MGFVYETISTEIGQELYDKYHFTRIGNIPVIPTSWVIDKERNAYMVNIRTQQGAWRHDLIEMPGVSNLIWNDQPIKIEFYDLVNERERTVKFYIKGIGIPHSLANHEDEVIELVKEAILADFSRGRELLEGDVVSIDEIPKQCYIWDGMVNKEIQ